MKRTCGGLHPFVSCLSCFRGFNIGSGKAKALYRRAPAIREAVLGPDHTFVAETLEGLAKVCEQTGRAAEAQELSSRAKRIRAQAGPAPNNPQPQA